MIQHWIRWLLLIAVGTALVTSGCLEKLQQHERLILNNYPKLFEKDVIIVIGENASQIELDGANAISYNLVELTGNAPVIKTDADVTEKERAGYNLILVGSPDSNKMFRDVYDRTNAARVTNEYPGAGKGILEVLRNPWNESKSTLLVEGSDEWGVRAGGIMLEEKQKLKGKTKVFVDWEETTGIKFPIDSAEEAIKYANTNIRVKEFIKKESAMGHSVGINAKFSNVTNDPYAKFLNMTDNWWFVEYQAIPLTSWTIYISPNGTIILGGVAA